MIFEDFLENFKNLKIKKSLADELKSQNLPLVMWGASETAEEVNYYLKKHNIFLADIVVDDKYYSENVIFDGKLVLPFSMLEKKYAQVNIILGHSVYEKISSLDQFSFVNKAYCLFSYVYGMYEKMSIDEIEEHIDEYKAVGEIFADEMSFQCYMAFLKTKISGNNSYIFEIFEKENSYFNNEIFKVNNNEVFMDIGAYEGDTICLFMKENEGQYNHIYAIEPDNISRKNLEDYICAQSWKRVTISEVIPWKESGKLYFITNENRQLSRLIFSKAGRIDGVGNYIKAVPLDKMFQYKENVTLIKMNYLDGVKEALEGAENILNKHKPKLAISVGFDCKSIREIPILIKKINPSYNLYLRFNHATISTLTCYGII